MHNKGMELRDSQQERGKDFSSRGLRREMSSIMERRKSGSIGSLGALDCGKKEIGVFSIMIPMVLFPSLTMSGARFGDERSS